MKHRKANRSWSKFERRFNVLDADEKSGAKEYWVNNLYHVEVNHGGLVPQIPESEGGWPTLVWLSLRRTLRCSLPKDWRDLQRIKNEIMGPDREGLELYPKESRLTDEADQFHLWVLANTAFSFPFGYPQRHASGPDNEDGSFKEHKGSQRPFEFDGFHDPVERCFACALLPAYCACEKEAK